MRIVSECQNSGLEPVALDSKLKHTPAVNLTYVPHKGAKQTYDDIIIEAINEITATIAIAKCFGGPDGNRTRDLLRDRQAC